MEVVSFDLGPRGAAGLVAAYVAYQMLPDSVTKIPGDVVNRIQGIWARPEAVVPQERVVDVLVVAQSSAELAHAALPGEGNPGRLSPILEEDQPEEHVAIAATMARPGIVEKEDKAFAQKRPVEPALLNMRRPRDGTKGAGVRGKRTATFTTPLLEPVTPETAKAPAISGIDFSRGGFGFGVRALKPAKEPVLAAGVKPAGVARTVKFAELPKRTEKAPEKKATGMEQPTGTKKALPKKAPGVKQPTVTKSWETFKKKITIQDADSFVMKTARVFAQFVLVVAFPITLLFRFIICPQIIDRLWNVEVSGNDKVVKAKKA